MSKLLTMRFNILSVRLSVDLLIGLTVLFGCFSAAYFSYFALSVVQNTLHRSVVTS